MGANCVHAVPLNDQESLNRWVPGDSAEKQGAKQTSAISKTNPPPDLAGGAIPRRGG